MFKKGIILVVFASLLSMYQVNAQDNFSFGPRVGLNFSNASNVGDNSKSLTGLVAGLTTTYSISEATGLTVDILASHEGYKIGEIENQITYLQIPILFDVFFGDLGDAFRPKVYAGVVPGFLLGAKVDGEKVDKDGLNGFNLGVGGGLGFNTRVASRIWLNADLRAHLGLSDIIENNNGDKVALSNVQPSIGLAYGLSRLE